MQTLGEPPSEILKDLAPDESAADQENILGSIFGGLNKSQGTQDEQCKT